MTVVEDRRCMCWLPTTISCAMLTLTGPLACTGEPNLPRPEEPLAGKIYDERAVVVGTTEVTAVLVQNLRVTIPAAAYPAGTRVTLRIVDCQKQGDTPVVLGKIFIPDTQFATPAAVQILPTSLSPAVPLAVRVQMPWELTVPPPGGIDPLRTASWGFDVLHAGDSDASFTTLAQDQVATGSREDRAFAFSINEPGLWTVGQWPIPASLQGRLVLDPSSGDPSTVLLPEAIELAGRSYTWARTDPHGCISIETGTLAIPDENSLVCRSAEGTTTLHALYVPDVAGQWLSIDHKRFKLQSDNRTPLVAGCPPDGGQVGDGGDADLRATGGPRD